MKEDAMVGSLPKAFELQSLRRLKEALVVSKARHGKSGMIPDKDWLADLDAKIAALERGLGLETSLSLERRPGG
ncbi:hypothetical protein NB311A_19662 [Nitrobacter sp. Nb-311A]|uniref:hypothetical protein n=1 Tax=Nitrobacter sp. Nb-311A TaxID=314253 RepID=UPI0000685F78|nr:hypothetical protein [Nitrobacter sp. Nb-311A]EAQ34821.1 hypothetical protein NB311A_19662 [Nitrobacter sp. Nb-311A]